MTSYLLDSYLPAFGSTIAIELGVALLLGFADPRSLLAVILVNVVTHPTLHVFLLGNLYFGMMTVTPPVIIALELAAVLTEGLLLAYALRLRPGRAATLSLAINTGSFLLGLLIFQQ